MNEGNDLGGIVWTAENDRLSLPLIPGAFTLE
jgi:hypothetical protein